MIQLCNILSGIYRDMMSDTSGVAFLEFQVFWKPDFVSLDLVCDNSWHRDDNFIYFFSIFW